MTGRTLRNRLAERGTHFQSILDQVRAQMACADLSGTRNKVEHIAWRVGFQDAPSFRRAFKRWTGLTPLEYRQRAQASSL
jgi:AraC-like DNA-binding protein